MVHTKISNKYPVSVAIIFPEFFRGAAFFLFKQAVEVGDIIEAAIVGYFRNRLGSINQ